MNVATFAGVVAGSNTGEVSLLLYSLGALVSSIVVLIYIPLSSL